MKKYLKEILNIKQNGIPLKTVTIIFCALFCVFIIWHGKYARGNIKKAVNEHARVIARSLWDLNPKAHSEYLIAAAGHNDYHILQVKDEKGNIFFETGSDFNSFIDNILIKFNITPLVDFQTDVLFEENTIGTVGVKWHCKTFYKNLYVILIFILILIALQLYNRILLSKHILEKTVDMRTDDLRQANAVLKESEARFSTFIQNAGSIILCLTPEYKIFEFNKEAEKLYGKLRDDVLGQNYLELFVPEQSQEMSITNIKKVLEGGQTRGFENEVIANDGSTRTLIWNVNRLLASNIETMGIIAVGQDITDRKQLEKERKRLTDILEATSDLVAIARPDANHTLIYMNSAGRKLLGWDIDEDINTKHVSDTHPEWAFRMVENRSIPHAIKHGVWEGETALIGSGGKEIPVSQVIMSHQSEDGGVEYFSTIMRDITGLKMVEKALLISEERYAALFERSLDAVYVSDLDGNFIDASPSCLQMMGYRKDETLIMNFTDILSEDELSKAYEAVQEIINTGTQQDLNVFRLRKKNGDTIWIETKASLIYKDRKPYALLGIARDITERKRSENALKENEEKFRMIFENANDLIVYLDKQGRVIDVNDRIEDLFGYKREEVISKRFTVFDNIDPDDKEKTIKLFKDAVKEGAPALMIELDAKRKDGSMVNIEVNTKLLKKNTEVIGSLSIIRDITERKQTDEERKQLELQLIQSQKMEAIGTLAGGIAHDFNNILSAIIGFTEISLAEAEKGSILEDNLIEVKQAGIRAADLVAQILSFSRKTDQEVKPVMVKDVLPETLKLLRASLPSNIKIHNSLESDSVIMADHTKIHQIFMNLCTNAAYAMRSKGGDLTICLEDVEMDYAKAVGINQNFKSGSYLKLSVSDTGPGIDIEVRDRIFDPYFTTKEHGEGTGMGLSVVHGIVNSLKGAIQVDTSPGGGAIFYIYFPIVKNTPTMETLDKGIFRGNNEKILFVDDEPAIARSMQIVLFQHGYQVEAFTNPSEALSVFRLNPDEFDLVITDMTMPDMTGDILTKELLKIRGDIPIILSTGYSDLISEEKAEFLGIKAFIMKPMQADDLTAIIRSVLE